MGHGGLQRLQKRLLHLDQLNTRGESQVISNHAEETYSEVSKVIGWGVYNRNRHGTRGSSTRGRELRCASFAGKARSPPRLPNTCCPEPGLRREAREHRGHSGKAERPRHAEPCPAEARDKHKPPSRGGRRGLRSSRTRAWRGRARRRPCGLAGRCCGPLAGPLLPHPSQAPAPRRGGRPVRHTGRWGLRRWPVAHQQSRTTNVYSPSCSCLSGASGRAVTGCVPSRVWVWCQLCDSTVPPNSQVRPRRCQDNRIPHYSLSPQSETSTKRLTTKSGSKQARERKRPQQKEHTQ